MTTSSFNFQQWLEAATMNIMKQAFSTLEKLQNTETHSFYVTFVTNDTRVQVPKFLHDAYPEEITIVLEHQFNNFKIINNGFRVTLYFNGQPAEIFCPFDCITRFYDKTTNIQFLFNYSPLSKKKPVTKKKTSSNKNKPKKKIVKSKEESNKNSNIITFKV